MATLPTTPPSVTAWPTSPSRARPSTFATEADAFLGHFPVGQADQQNLVNWLNSTAGQSYTNALEAAASATNSAASAQLAQDALDSAISATNYKGAWSSLSGALNIPASVSHNNGLWLLTTNLANVAASEPSEANSNWFLVFRKATDLDVENGTQYANPDAKQLKGFVQRNWSSLTTAKTYGDSCFYNGKEYVIRNPLTDPTIAPPSTAGRSYFEFDGVDDYITIPTITLQAGDVVKFKFRAPTSLLSVGHYLVDTGVWIQLAGATGKYSLNTVNYTTKVDGSLINASTNYPLDGVIHDVEITIVNSVTINSLAAKANGTTPYKGRIYDLEVIRGGNRIHYYPLRTDAVDYLAGNLVKDEEFTYSGNWELNSGTGVNDNALDFISAAIQITPKTSPLNPLVLGATYRVLYDYSVDSGSLGFEFDVNSVVDGKTVTAGTGRTDEILIYDTAGSGKIGISTRAANTTATVKNFRVIKLNELSPSASFTSANGFGLAGGVTITGGQAVFGAGAGIKNVGIQETLKAGKKYRIAYKTNSGTTGTYYVRYGSSTANVGGVQNSNGTFDFTTTPSVDGVNVLIYTPDGWNGNVEYFSVTEVTDGTENGSPVKTFDKYWQLTSGEQFLPSGAGLVKFGDNLAIDSNNTLEIEPLSNGSRGDTIKLARKEGFAPIVKLSAIDISAGKLIRYGAQTDTQLTLDTDKVAILIHNGTDLEVKI